MTAAQRVLAAAIGGYRRWLSGRGPLRRVRCTFHAGESCSSFGLRAAREAPSAPAAWGRIRRRLRRCRDASLFALTAADGSRALGWGADHERPLDELCAELAADGEAAAACATVLAARELVARWRGDVVEVVELAPRRRGLPPAQVALRHPPPPRRVARALTWRVALASIVVPAAALVSPGPAIALAAAAAFMLIGSARGHLARWSRLRHQAGAAALRAYS